jgi:hypothetical protein
MIESRVEVWLWLRAPGGGPGVPHEHHPAHDKPMVFAQPVRVGDHVMLAEADGCIRQWVVGSVVHYPQGNPDSEDFRTTTTHVVAVLG